jgi:tRNA dimethylallyltransferase
VSGGCHVAAIVGPTAVGKTAAALGVAEQLGAEIISIDSMQIYRGMDIGTDKVDPAARAKIPHHLIDLKAPSQEITVAEYRDLARAAIEDISSRGRLPLLVGGSGLYFRATVDDLRFPPTSQEIRERLRSECDDLGVGVLYSRLSEADPAAASKIEKNNSRRIIRALEVIELTGQPFSANDSWGDYTSRYTLAVAGLRRERSDLFVAIEERVDSMFESGLRAEVAALPALSTTARQALGYRQILDAPTHDDDALKTEIIRATKRFARSQESWFRSDPRVEWFDADEGSLVARLAAFFRGNFGGTSTP